MAGGLFAPFMRDFFKCQPDTKQKSGNNGWVHFEAKTVPLDGSWVALGWWSTPMAGKPEWQKIAARWIKDYGWSTTDVKRYPISHWHPITKPEDLKSLIDPLN